MNEKQKNSQGQPSLKGLSLIDRIKSLFLQDKKSILFLFITGIVVILAFSRFYKTDFISQNIGAAIEYFISTYILFFIVLGLFFLTKKVNDLWFNVIIFTSAFIYLMILYSHYIYLFSMGGDNLCQVAYWNILSRPNLSGSIGASLVKPGQVVLTGLFYQLSPLIGDWGFKIGLCLIMAWLIFILVRIAIDQAGRTAGIIAFFFSQIVFFNDFAYAEAVIYFIPVLFTGLWLYYYKPKFKIIGLILLALSIQFNIQAIAILAVIWCIHLIKKEWKDLLLFSGFCFVSLAGWVLFILAIQGSFARINSGAAAGYPGDIGGYDSGYIDGNQFKYMLNIISSEWMNSLQVRFLIILSLLGVAGSLYYKNRKYLPVFAAIIILVLNVLLLGGTLNFGRYFGAIYAFSCSVGVAVIVRYAGELFAKRKFTAIVLSLLTLIPLALAVNYPALNSYKGMAPGSITLLTYSASRLLEDEKLPRNIRLMSEDDHLYTIVIKDPDRFKSLFALQYFNVSSEEKRKEILSKTDYIWIQVSDEHIYYYLYHKTVEKWLSDPFRLTIEKILENNSAFSIYGYRLVPVDKNDERLILKVEQDS